MITLNPNLITSIIPELLESEYGKAYVKGLEVAKFLHKKRALGVAFNQLNIPMRAFVGYTSEVLGLPDQIILNPYYNPVGEEQSNELEGCLSFPGKTYRVKRYKHIMYRYYSYQRKEPMVGDLYGYPAIIFQHETDHLNGIICLQKGMVEDGKND